MWHPTRDLPRPGFRKRGYDSRWDREAKQWRRRNPYCVGCLPLGRRIKADVVDHVIPHCGDQQLFWSQSNWQSTCRWHHNAIKPELERLFLLGRITAADLRLSSAKAVQLTREQYRPAVGADGFACE